MARSLSRPLLEQTRHLALVDPTVRGELASELFLISLLVWNRIRDK